MGCENASTLYLCERNWNIFFNKETRGTIYLGCMICTDCPVMDQSICPKTACCLFVVMGRICTTWETMGLVWQSILWQAKPIGPSTSLANHWHRAKVIGWHSGMESSGTATAPVTRVESRLLVLPVWSLHALPVTKRCLVLSALWLYSSSSDILYVWTGDS